ncbi:nucleotidyltransferase domain-containing protein [Actinomycetota bacterium]
MGTWVNGGGWLTANDTAVDWILRDLDRVQEQCRRAVAGEYAFHAQPGHPLGFLDVSYAGEVATSVPLADPHGIIAGLRSILHPYPVALRAAMMANLWQAGFLIDAAHKGLPKNDAAYVMLCCSTALMVCAHAWHAAAGSWPTNEKGLVVDVAGLDIDTHNFAQTANAVLNPGEYGGDDLADVIATVAELVEGTRSALKPNP